MQKSKVKKFIAVIATLIVIAGLFIFAFSGENYQIFLKMFDKNTTSEELIELVRSLGIRGAIALAIMSMLQVVLTFLPAEPVQVLSGITYGLGYGILICAIGVLVGNTVIYLLYKAYGQKISKYFEKNIDLDFDTLRSSNKFAVFIFLLYFLPAIPYGLICFFTASINVRYPRYIFLTTIGAIPSIFIGVGLGHMAMSTSWIISLCVFVVLVILIVIVAVKRKQVFAKANELIHKAHQPFNPEYKVKKSNPILMFFGKIFIFFKLLGKTKLKILHKEKIKGPAIVLCNHGSFLDFLYFLKVLKGHKVNYVVARLYFYNKLFGWALNKGGAFPKSMFAPDVENLQNCIRVIKNNGILFMMPEARLSTAGKFEDIQDTTLKFVKKMNVPVYLLKLNGDYLARPKWGDKIRKGCLVEASLSLLHSKEEVSSLSEKELSENIINAIKYDDLEWLKTKPELKYKHKTLAEGLENILYRCPKCGKEFTIKTELRKVFCSECGFNLELNDRYAFTDDSLFDNFSNWYDWQNDCVKKEIVSNENFEMSSKVTLKMRSIDGKSLLRVAGDGVCTINRKGLLYEGTIDGKQKEKFFEMKNIYRLLFGAGEDFEIYEGKEIYYFVPEELRSAVKWYVVSGILKNLE